MNLDKLPFNSQNFTLLKEEVAELRDLTMKLTAELAIANNSKPASKTTRKAPAKKS